MRFACNGDCLKHRFMRSSSGEEGLSYLSPGLKMFFEHINHPMQAMASLLRQGRFAEEAMEVLSEEEAGMAKAGRNDPCPCGSGKKYKRCHGRP